MKRIYHLVSGKHWPPGSNGPYRPDSLEVEGFVHASYEDQVVPVANRYFASEPSILVLTIEVERLSAPVREESVAGHGVFPHIYGPIDREAIIDVQELRRSASGTWEWPTH